MFRRSRGAIDGGIGREPPWTHWGAACAPAWLRSLLALGRFNKHGECGHRAECIGLTPAAENEWQSTFGKPIRDDRCRSVAHSDEVGRGFRAKSATHSN